MILPIKYLTLFPFFGPKLKLNIIPLQNLLIIAQVYLSYKIMCSKQKLSWKIQTPAIFYIPLGRNLLIFTCLYVFLRVREIWTTFCPYFAK